RRMRDLARDPMAGGCIIRITPDCAHYEMVADAPVMPTSELPSHLGLQNYLKGSGSSYKATLHTHPIELVALSHIRRFCSSEELTRTLWSMIPETLAFAPLGLGFIPFANPGTQELADATLKEIGRYDVVLWEKHGTVAVGTDMMDAFDQTDVLNKAACIYKAACQMGTPPEGMSDAQMREIQELFHLPKTRVK
ncbi:MAG: rhamnulose-1-phosphate aldolase, partial [Bacteroidales bacterium]|nr:rhamnulose-1-phosphate aldolase [Bacteroidales bacterium]